MPMDAPIRSQESQSFDLHMARMARGLLHGLRDRVALGGNLQAEVVSTLSRAARLQATLAELHPAAQAGDMPAAIAQGIIGTYGEAGLEALAAQGYRPG